MTAEFQAAFNEKMKEWTAGKTSRRREFHAEDARRRDRPKRVSSPRPALENQPPLSAPHFMDDGSADIEKCSVVSPPPTPDPIAPEPRGLFASSQPIPPSLPRAPARKAIQWPVAHAPQPLRHKGKRSRQPDLLSPEDCTRVLAHIDAVSSEPIRDRTMFFASKELGLRACELSGLLVSTLQTATGELLPYATIMPGTAKRGRERTVPISPLLRSQLLRFREEYPLAEYIAFRVRSDGRINNQTAGEVSTYFRLLYAGMGLGGCTMMSGRHTFANDRYREGFSPEQIQKLMGHARLATTLLYLRRREITAEQINRLGRPA